MPRFTDAESAFQVVPEGDYVLCVYEFSTDISAGGKTRGCERYNIVFNIEGTDSKCKEQMFDHESCLWKIDTFLKACGITDLKKGDEFHFEKDTAEEMGVPWVNPMGLRCHAALIKETYKSERSGNEIVKNKVATYYVDSNRPKLPPDPNLRNKPTSTGNQF